MVLLLSDGCFSWGYTSFWVCSRANFTRGVAPFVVSPLQLIVTLDRVNILKEKDLIDKFLSSKLLMAVNGNFESVINEYIWYRNISQKQHIKRFKSRKRRKFLGEIEHPGGQSPVTVQLLINATFNIYIKSEDSIMDLILKKIQINSSISRIHLGRSEDVISSIEANYVNLKESISILTNGYIWIPSFENYFLKNDDYRILYEKIPGESYRISSIYNVINGIRVFERIPVKLFNGHFPMLSATKSIKIPYDGDIPVLLTWVVKR